MTMRSLLKFAPVLLLAPWIAQAQRSLPDRLKAAGTRTVAFSVRSRPEVCGDGKTSYNDGLSGPRSRMYDGMLLTHEPWDTRIPPCEKGDVRVSVRMVEGTPSWLRTAVGVLPTLGDTVLDLGTISTAEAGAFLTGLARGMDGRASQDALLPLVLIDSLPRWEILASAARDTSRLVRYRRRASDLLARAAAHTLGDEVTTDDDPQSTRREAVYALARQHERNEDPVPQLLSIAQKNAHRDARVAAIYQLGQLGDPRAVALFTSMLGAR
jgi:hypothetical protein